jgi:hypothetical protein
MVSMDQCLPYRTAFFIFSKALSRTFLTIINFSIDLTDNYNVLYKREKDRDDSVKDEEEGIRQ